MALVLPDSAFDGLKSIWAFQYIAGGSTYLLAGKWAVSNLFFKENLYAEGMHIFVDMFAISAVWMGFQVPHVDLSVPRQRIGFGLCHAASAYKGLTHWSKLKTFPKFMLLTHLATAAFLLLCKPKGQQVI